MHALESHTWPLRLCFQLEQKKACAFYSPYFSQDSVFGVHWTSNQSAALLSCCTVAGMRCLKLIVADPKPACKKPQGLTGF